MKSGAVRSVPKKPQQQAAVQQQGKPENPGAAGAQKTPKEAATKPAEAKPAAQNKPTSVSLDLGKAV
ncbi:MAG: hypothetical protein AB3N18_02680, partial [Allomuricauda sp.]